MIPRVIHCPTMTEEILVELDERRRASLARLDPQHRRYLAHVEDDGVIILRPVALVPAGRPDNPAPREALAALGGLRTLAARRP